MGNAKGEAAALQRLALSRARLAEHETPIC